MIYADSSFVVAQRVLRDNFHETALEYYEAHQDEVWLWSPWQRVEVFNTIRQLTQHPDKSMRLSTGEARGLIVRLQDDVRLGYFQHLEADWRDVLRMANDLSIEFGFRLPCCSADLLHVAYAKELVAGSFVSFDEDQLQLAKAAGLNAVRPD